MLACRLNHRDVGIVILQLRATVIDEGDVDAPENVFKQLCRFRGTTGRDWYNSLDCPAIKCHRAIETIFRITSNNFGYSFNLDLLISGILTFRRESQMKIDASAHAALRRIESRGFGLKTGVLFENDAQVLLGRSRISRGL